MTTREIINLSFGNFSNYVGASWLNSQIRYLGVDSEFDSNVLWRKEYCPRLITADFKNNYGNLNLEEQPVVAKPGQGKQTKVSESKKPALEDEVTSWSGKIETFESGNAGNGQACWTDLIKWKCENVTVPSLFDRLDDFSEGRSAFIPLQEVLEDSVRTYAEECDLLQGFHFLSDVDGFGGLSSGMLELLADDYDKKTRVCFALAGPSLINSDFRLRAMNVALLLNSFNDHSSVFSCLSSFHGLFDHSLVHREFPFFQNKYAELMGLTLDSLTSPYCLKRPEIDQDNFAGLLNAYGRKMCVLGNEIPFGDLGKTTPLLFDSLNNTGLNVVGLTPGVNIQMSNSFGNFIVPRGFTNNHFRKKGSEDDNKKIGTARSCFEVFAQETCPKSVNIVRSMQCPLFQNGGASVTTAHNTKDTAPFLQSLLIEATSKRTLTLSRALLSKCDVIEADDYNECVNDLKSLLDCYK